MSPAQRLVGGKVVPERAGYYIGHRMVERAVADHGIATALRMDAMEIDRADDEVAGVQSA
jgi:uncharacterized protein YjaZ